MGCPGCFPAGVVMLHLLLPALTASLLLAADARAQEDVRAILTRAIRARGGTDKDPMPRATRERTKAFDRQDGMTYVTNVIVQFPSQVRMHMELDVRGTKLNMIAGLDGDKGWGKLTGETQDLPEESVALLKRALYEARVLNLRPLLEEERFTLSALGESKVQGRGVVGVKVTHKGEKDLSLYFDR